MLQIGDDAGGQASERGRPPPLPAPAVLRLALRLLRVRGRGRRLGPPRRLPRRRSWPSSTWRAGRIGALDTVYLGGGTPTLMRPRRLRRAAWIASVLAWPRTPRSRVEANPETVDRPALRGPARDRGHAALAGRRSRSSRTCWPPSTGTPPRTRPGAPSAALGPPGSRRSASTCSSASPGQTPADLEADLAEVLALGPDHVSWYELELKPGSALARRPDVVLDEDVSPRTPTRAWWRASRRRATAGTRRPTSPGPGPRVPPQPGLLGRGRLPGPRRGRGQHGRRAALAQRPGARGVPGRARPGGGPSAHGRGPRRRRRCAASAGCSGRGWSARSTWRGPARRTAPTQWSVSPALGLVRSDGDALTLTRRGALRAERRPPRADGVRVSEVPEAVPGAEPAAGDEELRPRQELILRTVVERAHRHRRPGGQQAHRRAAGDRLRLLDRALRAGPARGAGLPRPPPHLGRSRAHGPRLPATTSTPPGPRPDAGRGGQPGRPARPGRDAARGRLGAAPAGRRGRPGDQPAGAGHGAAAGVGHRAPRRGAACSSRSS